MVTAIYEPAGKAREYARWACNLYAGCSNGCKYCYAPRALHRDRQAFHGDPVVSRKEILDAVRKDCNKVLTSDAHKEPVLLCFSCDPYPLDVENVTGEAVSIMGKQNIQAMVLTKQPQCALDLDSKVFVAYKTLFGTTIVFRDEKDRQRWEPKASSLASRLSALRQAKTIGLKTWISIEPVISPEQGLGVLRWAIAEKIDIIKIGKINYCPEVGSTVDWKTFAQECAVLGKDHPNFYLKESLRKYL